MTNNRELILKGSIPKALIKLSLPIMMGNFIQTLYQLADAYWVGKIGATELSATFLVWPIIFVMMSFGIGIGIAGTALISQYIGAKNEKSAKVVAGQLVSFSLVFSVILAVVGTALSPYILRLMGTEGDLFIHANTYLSIIFAGMPTMFVFFAYQCIKQGQGDTLSPMILSGISVVANIVIDPIFILDSITIGDRTISLLGYGVAGAAWATVLTRAIIAITGLYILFFKEKVLPLKLVDLRLNLQFMSKLLKVGIPSSIGQSMEGLGFTVLNSSILAFGVPTMTAFGIGNNINSLVLMPAMGIGQALATVIGQNLGANNIKRAKEALKSGIIISCTILFAGGLIIFSIADTVVTLFNNDPQVLKEGVYYLRLISITIPLMGIFQAFVGTFQGAGKTKAVMWITGGRLWLLRLPMIVVASRFTNLGSESVWYAMVLSNLITCVVAYLYYRTGQWQEKIIEKNDSEYASYSV